VHTQHRPQRLALPRKSRRQMKYSAILQEAWRNTISGTTGATTLAILLTLVVSGLAATDLSTIGQTMEQARKFRSSGAPVMILSAEGSIDGAACENLARLPGVNSSGSVRASVARVTPASLPDSPLPTMQVSPGFIELLNGRIEGSGVFVGPEAMEILNLSRGKVLETASGEALTIGGTYSYPDDGRRAGWSYALLIPTTWNGRFDECWAHIWPSNQALTQLLFTTLRQSNGANSPQLSQLNTTLGTSFNGEQSLRSRITGVAAPAGTAVGFGIGFLGLFRRRLQLASALHAGVTRRVLLCIVLLETAGWLAAAACVPIVAAATMHLVADDSDSLALWVTTQISVASALGALTGTCFAFAFTREERLFNYFKAK
jgi:hypothetical protein